MEDTNNMLSVLDRYMQSSPGEMAKQMSQDFRQRRVEKGITREQMAEQSGVAISNIVRFEQKGLISLTNLIALAMTLGYGSDIKGLFGTPKYSTMEELMQIRKNTGKTKAYRK